MLKKLKIINISSIYTTDKVDMYQGELFLKFIKCLIKAMKNCDIE